MKRGKHRVPREVWSRFRIFSAVVVLLLSALAVRLAQMQLLDGERYAELALDNAVKQRVVEPPRGRIYDRSGRLLVDNEPTYTVTVTPRFLTEDSLPLLADLLGVNDSLVQAAYAEARAYSPYKPSALFEEVPFEAYARAEEARWQLPGVGFEIGQRRRYHGPPRASHALGYVREADDENLRRLGPQGYRAGDRVGKTGVEKTYETVLRGRPGRRFVLTNVHGVETGPYRGGQDDVEPLEGHTLYLTIDADVQALAESLLVRKRGGVVALDARTGAVLALASAPDYDPAGFAGPLTPAFVDSTVRHPARPLFNRATQMAQPPGSTWKPLMAVAALEEGMIEPDTELYCGGGYRLGRLFRCHGGAHGPIAVLDALRVSCNTFFFRLMNDTFETPSGPKRMDLETFGTWAHLFGFGELAPLDIDEQAPGLIPDSSYYDRAFPSGWGPGYTLNLGIGQGNMAVTPLQLARYTAAIANGGTLVSPHLVARQVDPATGEAAEVRPRPRPVRLPVSETTLRTVRRGMELVVESGTARRAQIPGITVAGKTGTAENPHGEDHSVFIAYAPAEAPEIAVGVIVENGGYGSTVAAPIASLLIEQYLTGEVAEGRRPLVEAVRARASAGEPE